MTTPRTEVIVITVGVDDTKGYMSDDAWEAYDVFVSALRESGIRVAGYEYDDGTWNENGQRVTLYDEDKVQG